MTDSALPYSSQTPGASELWAATLEELRLRLSAESFQTWLAPVQFAGIEGNTVLLRIPNKFYADWIRAHYIDLITESLCRKTDQERLEITWEVDAQLRDNTEHRTDRPSEKITVGSQAETRHSEERLKRSCGLNPKYLFDNFVVGPSNQLANAACFAAASNPGKRYNPLFIYGGVGLGKTHLVNAVGHRMLESRPNARILYVSAERFTNEFIYGLQNHKINEFRERYRNQCDAVLIDDIQFLATREQTQEEFFHTFNALYHTDKQIVVSCDVFPQQIREMQERLVSRFQWGMIADIQPPELDTRVAIVIKKAEQEGITLSIEVATFIAETIRNNVRELEGSLLRLAVRAELLNRPIDLQLAKESLRSVAAQPVNMKTVEEIQQAVCDYFNIKLSQLKSHGRQRSIAKPRMIAMYLCRHRLGTSYTELGLRFGGKDHTTIINAVRKIGGLIDVDDTSVCSVIEAIGRKLDT